MDHYVKDLPKLLVGIGTFKILEYEIKSLNSKNVLIIADSVAKENKLLQLVKSTIASSSSIDSVHTHFVQNVKKKLTCTYHFPTTLLAEQYDAIIGVGDNDLLNYTKIVALFSYQFDEDASSSTSVITKANKALMLLPSVVTYGMEVTNKTYTYNNKVKIVKNNELMTASTIIYDPLLSMESSLYERVTSSVITFAHAFENHFFSQKFNRFPKATLKLLFKYVIRATYNKRDIEAQEALLKSGMLLGLTNVYCLEIPLINCFAIPIMRKTDCSYAVAIAVMLPYVIKMYRNVNEQRGTILMNALDVPNENMTDIYRYMSFRLANTFKTLGCPLNLETIGISQNDVTKLGSEALVMWLKNNVTSPHWSELHFTSIFMKAYDGGIHKPFN